MIRVPVILQHKKSHRRRAGSFAVFCRGIQALKRLYAMWLADRGLACAAPPKVLKGQAQLNPLPAD
jgi:hypothetical protein